MQLRDEDWDTVININLTATFRLSRAAMKTMMRRRFGRIIGITSVVGVTGNPGQSNYTAAKAGMIGMMKSIAKEYARRGVTANCVAPGFIATADDRQAERQAARGDPADGAVRAARDAATISPRPSSISPPTRPSYVTGQTLHVNGGMAMI